MSKKSGKAHRQWAQKRMNRPEKLARIERGSGLIYDLINRTAPRRISGIQRFVRWFNGHE